MSHCLRLFWAKSDDVYVFQLICKILYTNLKCLFYGELYDSHTQSMIGSSIQMGEY